MHLFTSSTLKKLLQAVRVLLPKLSISVIFEAPFARDLSLSLYDPYCSLVAALCFLEATNSRFNFSLSISIVKVQESKDRFSLCPPY